MNNLTQSSQVESLNPSLIDVLCLRPTRHHSITIILSTDSTNRRELNNDLKTKDKKKRKQTGSSLVMYLLLHYTKSELLYNCFVNVKL